MSPEMFDQLFEPVRKKWEHHFTGDVCKQIYHIVKGSPEDGFKRLVSKMIWNKPFSPPDISEFLEFSRSHSKKLEILRNNFCEFCGYIGTVSAEDKHGRIWAFRCECPNARDLPTEIKLADNDYRHWYTWREKEDSGKFKILHPIDRHLRVFSDEERRDNWKFLWDVLYGRIEPSEIKDRLGMMERAIQYAKEARA